MARPFFLRAPVLALLLPNLLSCGEEGPRTPPGPVGTPELRESLFDSILAMTARREAFSAPKEESLGFEPLEAMEVLRDDVVEADSEEALFYALTRLSNARRDRHLSVALVDLGIRPQLADGLEAWGAPDPPDPWEAPVRFLPDYGSGEGGYFVADVAQGDATPGLLEPGDRILSLNGLPADELEVELGPFIRHSTIPGLRWKLAETLSRRTGALPPSFLQESLVVEARKEDGTRVTETFSYEDPTRLTWAGSPDPDYPGFQQAWSSATYDLFLPRDDARLLILQWHRFEGSSLVEDVDRLVAFARDRGLLDHAVLFDATRSGGGSLGAYAVQRLQPRPFKTTFGTLRLSDVIEPFIQMKREELAREASDPARRTGGTGRRSEDPDAGLEGARETVDDGSWLLDWLENDVFQALDRRDSVTAPVPFKLAHASKESDGILQPAPVHFRGPLVVLSGPHGGSHLDQFMSIVKDNGLGHILGMPAGGYSNTWEWEEVLFFPGTNRPVAGFMWSIGHTIRPNGEVLEGNPARVDEWIPLTAENVGSYHRILLDRALAHLERIGFQAYRR